jgi:hypothetical protein
MQELISPEAVWDLVESYNKAIFPFQIVTLTAAVILICFLFTRPGPKLDKLMKAYLTFTYAWIGVMFAIVFTLQQQLLCFIPLGIFLIIIAIFLAIDIFAKKIEFKLPDSGWTKCFSIFWIICAFVLYPLIGWIVHQQSPMNMLLGVLPCPTTILSLALLAGAIPETDRKAFILLLGFALISGICALMLHIYIDFLLIVAGIYGLVMLIKGWQSIHQRKRFAQIW